MTDLATAVRLLLDTAEQLDGLAHHDGGEPTDPDAWVVYSVAEGVRGAAEGLIQRAALQFSSEIDRA